jgi:hypothetical protein
MFACGIGVLPLIRRLKRSHPNLFQPWYADDAGAGGKFSDIRAMFEELQEIGPAYGYFPEPTKSILVVPPAMVERATEFSRSSYTSKLQQDPDTLVVSSDPEIVAKNMSKVRY